MSISSWLAFRDEVKSSLSCVDYLHSRGFNVSKSGQSIICPPFIRTDSDSPSFAVYDDHCFDFVTNSSYDIIDLCALDQFNGNKTHALELLAGRKLPPKISQSHSSLYDQQAKSLTERINFWHSELLKNPIVSPNGSDIHILDYLHNRGISLDNINSLMLGYSPKMNRLMIPFFNRNHQPVYASGRDMSGNSSDKNFRKYWYLKLDDERFSEVLDKCIFGIDSLRPGFIQHDTAYDPELGQVVKLSTHHIKYDFLAVCEGLFDVLSFRAQGWSAITGKISHKQEREFLDICRSYRDKDQTIFICFDNDKAGQDFQRNIALLLFRNGIPFVAGHLPDNVKDVSDYYAAGGSLDNLVRNARDGMQEIASLCRNEDELQQRFIEAGRYCSRWQIDKLKKFARSVVDFDTETETDKDGNIIRQEVPHFRFDHKAINFMYSEAMRPLQDCDIAHFVEEKHNLIYDTLGQFYEYQRGVWQAMNDLIIQQKIIRIMNGHISAQKVTGVCKYLKMDLAEDIQFNTKHNVVFQNGTLWLDEDGSQTYDDPNSPLYGLPKNFKPSRPEDMSTIQVAYNYDPKAHNTVLERAAREWTNNPDGSPDTEKYRLLKQMFGYILFVKNTLQKFFILKGDGANGKSTCMHCIEAILGKKNTTSLQISRLASEFDPIVLKNSRVNLCYDAQSSIENAQEVLKALIGGDQITAAHKGVDAESFTTNAKFIVSANKFFSANDLSQGLLRRMLFIAFNNTFTPTAGESNIEDEIMQDLPGLFNFAYDGYKDLMASGYFVETEEQKALLEEFREQLSPVILFAREELYTLSGMELDEKTVYQLYRKWCWGNGEKALGRTKFIPEIRQVIRTDGNVIPDPYRDNNTKQWIFRFPETTDNSSSDGEYYVDEDEDIQQKTGQENQQTVYAYSDRQEVQEVSKSYEEQESTKPEESAPVYSGEVSAEQGALKAEQGAAQADKPSESRSALSEQHVAGSAPQMHFTGMRLPIPDAKNSGFSYDEYRAWSVFRYLKRFGRNWKTKIGSKFEYDFSGGLKDDWIQCITINDKELQNMGIFLLKNPMLKACLPGIEDTLDFGV